MAILLFDFANQETRNRYPRHGWSLNSQGIKLLWFPVVPLADQVREVRSKKGARVELRPRDLYRYSALGQKLHSLLVVLRELHRLKQIAEVGDYRDAQGNVEALYQYRDLVPVYLDSYYIYLRRVADTLTNAFIPILFDDYLQIQKSDFKNLRKGVIGNSIPAQRYLCDRTALVTAFTNHSTWYDSLSTEGTMGVRDALEHEIGSWLDVGVLGTGVGESIYTWRMQAYLRKENKTVTDLGDLIERIYGINNDFCSFCTELHAAVSWGDGYHVGRGSVVYQLFGEGEDVAGFWPSI